MNNAQSALFCFEFGKGANFVEPFDTGRIPFSALKFFFQLGKIEIPC